jgi:hypothetical protein
MQVTVMCPGCARLLTVKVQLPDRTAVICPTCGWKGRMDEQGNLIEELPAGDI